MPKESGLGDLLFINGYDVSGDIGSLGRIACPRPTLDVTGINSSARERVQGPADGAIAFRSWFNDAAGQEHAALKAKTDPAYCMAVCGGAQGDPCAMLVAVQTNYDGDRGADGSLALAVEALAKGHISGMPTNAGLEWGTLVAQKQTIASAGATVGEVTAQTTAGAALQLQVFSVASGTPTFVAQDSSDTTNGSDGSWATLKTFTIQAQGAERQTVAGTVEKGVRLNAIGTFTDAVVAMGIRRGTAQDSVAYTGAQS